MYRRPYRRLAQRDAGAMPSSEPAPDLASDQYPLYPSKDEAGRILDIGFGGHWFLAAGLKLGDSDLSAADFKHETQRQPSGLAEDLIRHPGARPPGGT
jgi:hypothetical protein